MGITSCLRDGDLRELFIEHLGWDHARGNFTVEIGGEQFEIEKFAQKRGFLVVRLVTDRPRVQTRRHLRAIQAKVSRLAHEHLLVVVDEKSQVQVWAWAYRDGDNGRLKHRFHPFYTDRIPPRMVERIERLSVTLEEEERITLFDVLQRTRNVLNSEPDQDVFFRRPGYAQRSHELALRMRKGSDAEFHEFILFHQKLALWFARRYRRIVNDEEVMVQEAMVGLIRAAKRFDPNRGTAFSTYAYAAMRNECLRALPRLVPLGRVPDYLYWRFRRVMRQWDRAIRIGGPEAGLDARNQAIQDEGMSESITVDLYRMLHPTSLQAEYGSDWSDCLGACEYTHDNDESGRPRNPLVDLMLTELFSILLRGLDSLPRIDGDILRLRFGLTTQRRTLEEIGDHLEVTRERIRQREKRALGWLRRWFLREYGTELPPWQVNETARVEGDENGNGGDT